MAQVRMVKCPICEERFDRNQVGSIKIRNRWIHDECVPARIEKEVNKYSTEKRREDARQKIMLEVQEAVSSAEQMQEEQRELSEKAEKLLEDTKLIREEEAELRSEARSKNGENEDRRKLIEYIHELFLDEVQPKVYRQIESFRWNKGYTYKEIHATLFFFYNIQGNDVSKSKGGIGIVPYVIEDARYFYQKEKEKRDKLAKTVKQLENEEKVENNSPKRVISMEERDEEVKGNTIDLFTI